MKNVPRGHTAVMASRIEPPNSLDFFPTPPWATRALLEHVLDGCKGIKNKGWRAWDPAAGEGHMSGVLAEYFDSVLASDVFDYGLGHRIGSFVGEGADVVKADADWIITNPPFRLAMEFAERALSQAKVGVCLLVRSVWSETAERYERLFSVNPPTIIAQFAERVPIVKGRWDPDASSATAFAWFCWNIRSPRNSTAFQWIPPGCRKRLIKCDDVVRFAMNPTPHEARA
jgi:hypothetical protein